MLEDGRVLVTGGKSWGSTALTSAELYDPVTGRWTSAGNMAEGHAGHVSLKLQGGKIFVVGGLTETAELYDPPTNTWSSAGRMAKYRIQPTATLLQDGKVLVVGGDNNAPYNTPLSVLAELFLPETKTWVIIGEIATTRRGATATMLLDGTVLVVGGNTPIEGATRIKADIPAATAELYSPLRK
jgi:N-acetylneuraminic acid mutarotase